MLEQNDVAWYDRLFLLFSTAETGKIDLLLDKPRRFPLDTPELRMQAAVRVITWLRTRPNAERRAFCAELEAQYPVPSEPLRDRMLTWEQVSEMARAGIAFGGHTMTHPVLSRLAPEELPLELAESKALIEARTALQIEHFAYPFGKASESLSVSHQLRQYGYKTAVTTEWGLNRPGTDPFALRRVSFVDEDSLQTFAFNLGLLFAFPPPLGEPQASPMQALAASKGAYRA